MYKLSATVVCLVLVSVCYGQQATVKGNIVDSFNHQKMANAVIALLQSKDSILCTFTRSDGAGGFELKNITAGHYLLMISAPGFADYVDAIRIAPDTPLNYGTIFLLLKARLLEDVVVRQTVAAIKMKGDTTEYMADSFKVKANASVEELLKKLPGIQVDRNGQITAYGETVQRVLVDGEEFFSNDPTLVTQNLRADMIDKVQVFDKKSDQAVFTGVEDGQKSKTINLKLKEDKKQGYFGKVSVADGTEKFHDIQGMFNLFKKKEKLAAYGIRSSTGAKGLGWSDAESYGQKEQMTYSEDQSMYVSEGPDRSWTGRYDGRGLPLVNTGGVHYSNKWNEGKMSVNGNYKIQDLTITGASDASTQYLLPDSSYYSNNSQSFSNNAFRQQLSGSCEAQLDSSSSLKITANGTQERLESVEDNYSASLAGNRSLVNESTRSLRSGGNDRTLNTTAFWRKKFQKTRRTVSISFKEEYSDRDNTGFLNATTSFYNRAGLVDSIQNINQLKRNKSTNLTLDANIIYTEPLSVNSTLVFNYGFAMNNNSSARSSYNKVGDKYELFDSTFSSDFDFDVFTHKTGINYTYSKKKLRASAGGNIGITTFNQNDLLRNLIRNRHFINWFPQASLNYNIGRSERVSIKYNGSTRQPGIEDIQPLRTNDNPLFITIGNPDLKPSFNNNFNFQYSSISMATRSSLWIYSTISTTHNAISRRSLVNEAGKTTSQAVNVNGNWDANISASYNTPVNERLRISPGMNVEYSKSMNYVNGLLNATNSINYGVNMFAHYGIADKLELEIRPAAYFTKSRSSVQQQLKTSYWTYNIRPDVHVYLPGKIEFNTNLDINLRQKLSPGEPGNNVVLWNASLEKKFLKTGSLTLKLSVNDLLNQNNGFNRYVGASTISQSTYTTIRRYGLLSLVWNFNKMGTSSK